MSSDSTTGTAMLETPTAIAVEGLARKYTLYARPVDRLKELVSKRQAHRDFWAVTDVSFTVPRGQTLGIVGQNGSGKSTLLQVLAGVLQPTRGSVRIHGRTAALLELGAGFNPDFTGRENVLLSGAIMGIPETEMRQRLQSIIEFADLGEFIEEPMKTYSSGMYVRLAFATAISVDPDVLLVDEALAVGDAFFQHRCMLRMAELQARGVTIVLVSHDAAAIKRLCQRAIWLQHGRIRDDGEPERVIARYLASMFQQVERQIESRPEAASVTSAAPVELAPPNVDRRFGDGGAEVVGIGLFDEAGARIVSHVHGRGFDLRVQVLFRVDVAKPMVGFVLRDRLGTDLASSNTTMEGYVLPPAQAGDTYTVSFACHPPRLHPGSYTITATVAGGDPVSYEMHDWVDNAITLELTADVPIFAVMRFPIECKLEVRPGSGAYNPTQWTTSSVNSTWPSTTH